MIKAFWLALQFFTRLPTPHQHDISAADLGRSVLAYPVVGAVIGLLLLLVSEFSDTMPAMLAAALLLLAWVVITGALHLDGLADSADAWLGGLGDRERTMAIMKDPYCGPAGVVVLVITLLLKFVLLLMLIEQQAWSVLIIAPLAARAVVVALLRWTPYVRANGIGASHAAHLPQNQAQWALLGSALFALLVVGWQAITLSLALALTYYLMRSMMIKRLGGTTGDTAGALIEVGEIVALMALLA